MRRFTAPGRVNLIGEHTDHSDGLVLPAAIDLGITLDCEMGGDRLVLRSRDQDGVVNVAADGSDAATSGWGRFVTAVATELDRAGRPPDGLRGDLYSDLPQGAGLSSSAALEVVIATALCAAAGFDLAPLDLAALCQRAERRAVGVPSGIMDQAASILGRTDHAVLLDCATLQHRAIPIPAGTDIVIIDSGVRRQLESIDYATRVQELQRALPALAGRQPAEVAPDDLPVLTNGLDQTAARRLRHVVTENQRVRQTVDSLERGNVTGLRALFAASHTSLRDDFEVSMPELDTLVESATDAGAVAARMTGGGFGGSIVVLSDEASTEGITDEVLRRYSSAFPDRRATAHVCRAADGAREL
jgi:galactokinase